LKKIFSVAVLLFAFSFSGPVSYYGELKVRPNAPFLEGAKTGAIAQVRGASFGWSNTGWESERFYTAEAVERIAKDWKADIARAAYGATSSAFSSANAADNRERIEIIVEAAIANDIYAIIDWHSHGAENELQQSKDFFEYMASKYGSYDHVIFEIYNEPVNAEWPVIKSYAEEIIPVIRKYSDNLILVGTPFYSQKVQRAIGNKIKDKNVGYVLHFYAASHNANNFRDSINAAINDTLPIFATEYGTTHADGGCSPEISNYCNNGDQYNSHRADRSDAWHAFMDSKRISSVAWNINDKYEGSAFFGAAQRGFDFQTQSWSDTAKMTESGKYIFKKLNEYYLSAPWNPSIASARHSASLASLERADFEVYSLSGKKMGILSDLNLKSGVYILVSKQNGIIQRKILKIAK
jgi:endoglucanase